MRDDYPDALDYLRAGKNVLIMRTFSKIYALAGLRIGYAYLPAPAVLQALNQVREPFNVANLAQWAAIASLRDPQQVARSRAVNEAGKAYLYAAFTRLGLPYVPTQSELHPGGYPATLPRGLRRNCCAQASSCAPAISSATPRKSASPSAPKQENARFIAALEACLV